MNGNDAIFDSTRSAVVFALGFSTQQYGATPLSKLQRNRIGSGKGLVGMDGAGQAGMVLAQIARLGQTDRAVIVARFAPRFEPSPCCGPYILIGRGLALDQDCPDHRGIAAAPTACHHAAPRTAHQLALASLFVASACPGAASVPAATLPGGDSPSASMRGIMPLFFLACLARQACGSVMPLQAA